MNVSVLRPLRFGIVGVFNTVFGLAIIFGAKYFGLADFPANLLGYGLGLMVSFALNRQWTFRDRGRTLPVAWRFALAFALAYALNLATVFGLRDLVHVDAYLAQAAGVLPYTLFFYFSCARWVFQAQSRDTSRAKR